MVKNLRMHLLAALALLVLASQGAVAQDRKPITILVPFAPGGPVDTGARLVANKLTEKLGNPVVIDNRPGGNAIIAAQAALNAPADGHTLYIQSVSVISPVFIKGLKFEFDKEFEPVAPVWTTAYFLLASDQLPVKTLPQVIKAAKDAPGKWNYGFGTASSMLTMEMMKTLNGLDIVGVAYKGSAPTAMAMLSNDVQFSFDLPGPYKQFIDNGKVRAIAYTGGARSATLPDVPTVGELGAPELQITLTGGFWAKAGSPKDMITRIANATREALDDPEMAAKFTAFGWSVLKGTPEELRKTVNAEREFWAKAAKAAKYEPE